MSTISVGKRCFSVMALAEGVEFTVYVRRDGRMTIPKEVRDVLRIKEGSLVKCKIVKVNVS